MAIPNILLFALGIAAIAAPLWVHLRLGRVRKRAVVSSLHLMLAAPQSSRTPRRIINWPLFLLRCLLILLVALGFGRLLIPSFGSDATKADVAFVVDVSGSMLAEHAGQTVWAETSQALANAIDSLDRSSRVVIIPSPIGSYKPTWESPEEARARAAALRPGHSANRLASEMREAIRLLSEMPGDNPKILHIFSDFQRSSLVGTDSITLPANIGLEINQFGPQQMPNRGLTVSVIAAGATDMGFYAFSDGSSGDIQLIENDDAARTFPITPGQSASRLTNAAVPALWIERRLVLDASADTDRLAADNVAFDAFEPQQPIPIWLYEPRGEVAPQARQDRFTRSPNPPGTGTVSHIYEQASYFLSTALQPGIDGEAQALSRFLPLTLTAAKLPAALESLEKPGAPRILFIPATAKVPPDLALLAKTLVARGGVVIFFSGPELDPAIYQTAFGNILPVEIGASEALTLTPALATIDDRHPLWGGLDPQNRRQMAAVAMRKRSAIQPAANTRTLAHYADATPLIVEATRGGGRVYFVNSSADRGWSDWPANPPLFVPAIHLLTARALGYDTFAPAHAPWIAGQRTTLKLDPVDAGKIIRFDGQEARADTAGFVRDIHIDTPGIHDISGEDGSVIRRVAVNFPPSESILENHPESVARQRLESLRRPTAKSAVRWEATDHGGLAWKLCLALASLLLLVEPIFATRRTKA